MFTGGGIKPWPTDTVIHWDRDGFPDCGRIVAVGNTEYTVKNGKGEQRSVAIHDRSIRVVRRAENLHKPFMTAMSVSSLNAYVNNLWLTWKAN